MEFLPGFMKLLFDNGTGGDLLFKGVDPVYARRACSKLDP